MKNNLVIGMFGTCGNSTFRKETMIPAYEKEDIEYFNPQVEDWNPALAKAEAHHLANDDIILFPILSETYGLGSLGEIGFSISQAMRFDNRRDFVFLIDRDVDESLKLENEILAKESVKQRALNIEHINQMNLPNVYLVDTIEEMIEVSIALYSSNKIMQPYKKKFNV